MRLFYCLILIKLINFKQSYIFQTTQQTARSMKQFYLYFLATLLFTSTLNAQNQAPTPTDDHVNTPVDTAVSQNAPGVLSNDSDPDGDNLSVISFTVNGTNYPPGLPATISGVGTIVINGDGSFTFTPETGFSGNVPPITYTVNDGNASSSAVLYITVGNANNNPPNTNDDNAFILENTTLNENAPGLLSNDSDPDGDAIHIVSFVVNGNSYSAGTTVHLAEGDLTINTDGSYTFVPASGYTGSLPVITYTVTDGQDTADGHLYITVRDNSAPDAQNDTATTLVNTSINQAAPGLLDNDSDPDGDPISITSFSIGGNSYSPGTTVHLAEGDLTINADGSYTFVPASGYTGNVPTVTYTVSDGVEIDTATLSITVRPNNPPNLQDDTGITTEGVTLNSGTPGVLGNDSDPDGDPLTVVSFNVNGHNYTAGTTVHLAEGDLTLNADGSYTFVPASGFTGFVPTVTYTASDGYTTSTAHLDIIVDVTDTAPEMWINSCNQGYTASGYYKIYYDVYIENPSYAYGATNLQITNDLRSIFGGTWFGHCIVDVDRMWLDSGNTLPNSTDPAMYNAGSWDTNEYDETDATPGREGIFNANAVNNNILYPRQYITFGVCLLIDPSCAGGDGVGSGNGVTFDNIFELTSSLGDTTEHLSISDFHTSQTTVAAGIYVPVTTPPINGDGTYDFDLIVTITNDGSATANDVQFFLPLYELTQNSIPINSVSITQTAGAPVTTNATYDPADISGTNTGILANNQSLAANSTVQFTIHYNVGPTSYSGYCGFHAPNPSMTQGNADVILPGGGGLESPAQQSYVIWSDSEGDHLDRYYALNNATDIPSSEWQCTCDTNGISFNYNIRLRVEKTIINDVPAASDLRGNRDITFQIVVTNRTSSDVQVENPVLTDDLADICDATHIVQVGTPAITASSALVTPNINANYNGISDTNIFDNNSGILQPGESVTVQFTVEFDDPCFGVNYAVLGGNDPSGNSTRNENSGVEVEVYPDFDNDKLPDNVDIDDDNDGILDVDEACPGLNGSYYGTNHWIWNTISTLRRAYESGPLATFVATTTNFNDGGGGLSYGTHLQNFLGADAASLDNDPPNNRRGIIILRGYVYMQAGTYNFRVTANDGFRIRINGNTVAERNSNGGTSTVTYPTFNISQTGYHPIDILYWNTGGAYAFDVELRRQGSGYVYLDDSITLRDCDMDNDNQTNNVDLDTDNDGIVDILEANGTDTDFDGQVDYPIPGDPTSLNDNDNDGLSDTYDLNQGGTPIPNPDTDGDGQADFRDIDADNDGIVDYIEAQTTFGPIGQSGTDADHDGIDDAYDTDDLIAIGLGGLNGTYIIPINTDGADTPDYIDTNSDNDADSDYVEGWDMNNDRTPDTPYSGTDADLDGLDDAFDTNNGFADPTNGNQTAYNFPDMDTPGGDRDWREICTRLTLTKDDGYPLTPQTFMVGDVITYQIHVTNSGTVPLTNITVTDNNATIVSGSPIGSIDAYDTVTLTATHTVTQADIDAGQVLNSATGTTTYDGNTITDVSDDTDPNVGNADDDPTLTLIERRPEVTVTKDDQMPYTAQNITLGQTITYQIIVQNTGNVALSNIVVTDANAQIQGNNVISNLAPGETAVLTATHIVTQAEIDAGVISNQAVATVTYNGVSYSDASDDTDPSSPGGDDDPTLTHIIQNPQLTVTKNDQLSYTPQNMVVGDVITYEILVTNTGNVSLGLINVSENNAVTISGNPITNLAPGATGRVVAQHTITQADIDAGQVVNSATASVDFNGSTYSDTSDDTDPSSPGGDDDPTITFLVQNPGIEVTKDDGLVYLPQNLTAGDVIHYNIVVTNTGNVTLTNIDVTDANATITGSANIASLDVGQSVTVTAEHTVTYAEVDAGFVSNSATATLVYNNQQISDISDDTDPNSPAGSDDPTITLIKQIPEVTVTKDDGYPYTPQNLVVGDVITYTITVTNTGNVTLSDIVVTDPNATIVSGSPIATLAQGDSATVYATYTVTQDDINAGSISNTAIATVNYNGTTATDMSDDTDPAVGPGDDDPTVTLIGQFPELTVKKDDQLDYSPQNLSVGDVITYQITVTNTGNVELHSIVVTDANAQIQGSNTIAVLPVGQSVSLTATHTITQDEVDAGEVNNTAVATVVHEGVSYSDLSDDTDLSSPSGDDDPTVTHIVRNPALLVTKDDQLSYTAQNLSVGDVITYHIYVKNTGNMTLGVVNVSDANASIVSGNPILNLAPGATAMVVAEHVITQADLDAGQVSNSAIASTDFNGHTYSDTSDDTDPNSPPGDDDPTITFLVQTPDFIVQKDDQLAYVPQNLAVGDPINYNIYVTNTGNVTLNNVIINDNNATISGSNVITTLGVGQTEVIQATHIVTLADIDAGQVSNSATGTVTYQNIDYTDVSDDTDPNAPANDDDPTLTFIAQRPEITLLKDDQLDYTPHNLAPGDVITYNITVTNTGNVTLTNITVTDSNANIISGSPIASLAPGDSANVTATHTVTQQDIDSGQIMNSATGSTSYNGGNVTDLSDDADPNSPGGDDDPTITFIGQNTALEVTKDDQLAYTPQNLSVGDVVTYLITIKNIGNVTLNNIHVTDNNANIQGNTLIASLDPGQIATLTATHTVTQADIDAGQIVNTAVATVNLGGVQITDLSDDTDVSSPSGNDDPTITHIRQLPEITVTKDDHLPYTAQNLSVGDVISYQIEVTNTGNVTLPVINLVDNNANIISGTPIQNLAPGSTALVNATHTVTQADINAGKVENSAVASSEFNGLTYTDVSDDTDPDSPTGDDDNTITHIIQNPSIVVTKDDGLSYLSQNLHVGDIITYTITVTNNGNVDLHNIRVLDDNASISGLNIIPNLSVGQSASLTATHTVTLEDINNGQVSNSATASCSFAGQIVSDISDDTDIDSPAGNDDPTITHIVQAPSLTVLKDDNLDYTDHNLHVGDIITYQITVINTGNVTLQNITITDNNADIISGNPIASLDPGSSDNIIANHTITQADIDAGFVSNQAVATCDFNGNNITDLSDDTDTASPTGDNDPTITHLSQIPDITVTKDDQMDYSEQHLNVGDVIDYVIVVKNTGNVTLNNIIVTDTNANIQGSNVINTLAPGEIATIHATHTINQNEINAGVIYNSATAQVNYNTLSISDLSDDTDLLSPSGDDDPTITHLYRYAGIELTKDDQLAYTPQNLQVGDMITYHINVTNTGNVTLPLVTVSDNNANIISGNPIVDLFPGVTAIVTAQHMVTQADIDAGEIINSATATTSFNGQNFADISDDTDPDAPSGVDDPTVTHLVQNPLFEITKDDGLPYNAQNIAVGDVINYLINVTNTGNVTLHNIEISDDNATILGSQIITDLNVGQTVSINANHTVTQADIDAGIISNSATGNTLFNGNNLSDISDDEDVNSPPGDDDPTLTHINQRAELTVLKDDNLPYTEQNLSVGDVIVYTITVTNTGNVTLQNIEVTDANATITSGTPILQLNPGESVMLSATHTITQADIDAGQVVNSAIATTSFNGTGVSDTSDDADIASPSGNNDPTVTHLVQTPGISITKDDQLAYTPQNLNAGDIITYQLTVTNTGNVTLQNIVVSDSNANITGNSLITSLAPGESVTIEAEHHVTQDDVNAGQVINSATANVQYGGINITDVSNDPDPASPLTDDDPTITYIQQNPSIVVTKDDQLPYTPQNMSVGDVITYQIVVQNTGNVTFDLVTVTDNNANIISGNPVTDLTPGNSAVITATHTITQTDLDLGMVSNSATASAEFNNHTYTDLSDDTDVDSPVGPDDATVTYLVQNPVLELTKDDQLAYTAQNLAVGDFIFYNIYVTNAGNVTLTNIIVTDDNATINGSNSIAVLNVGETVTLQATHVVTQADIDAGVVSNAALGTTRFNNVDYSDISDDTDPFSPAGPDDATLTHINQNPSITLTKDDQLGYDPQNLIVGDVITYNILVSNTGNTTLTNINVTDNNATIISGNPIGSLAPGYSATVVATYTITQDDINNGSVSNSASVETEFNGNAIVDVSDDTDPQSPSGTDDPTITHIAQNPGITVLKDDQLDYSEQALQVGDVINYQIIVTNTGNVSLNNIQITDQNAVIQGANTIPSMEPGENVTLSATHTVTQADINAGQIVNQAMASLLYNGLSITDMSDDLDPVSPSGDDDPTITHIAQNPEITVTKDDQLALIPQNLQVGDAINYRILVTNTGNISIDLVTVSDNNANIISGNPITDLYPGNTATVIAQHIVTQADIDQGLISNQATAGFNFNGQQHTDLSDDADPDAPAGDDDPTITLLLQNPSFAITKDDQLPYTAQNLHVGDNINYNIVVTNDGNVTLNHIEITDNNANISGVNVIPTLLPGENTTLTATHTVTQLDIDSGEVINQAEGICSFNNADVTDLSDDTDINSPIGDNDPTITHLVITPELTVTKDDQLDYSEQNLLVGDIINYQIVVTNTGNTTLHDIQVIDDNADIISGAPILVLNPGEHALVIAQHTVTQADIDAGEIINSATASTTLNGVVISDVSDDLDPNSPLNDDDPTVTHIIQTPELTVTKDDQLDYTPQDLAVGDVITYQIIMQNTGNVTFYNVTLSDNNASIQGSTNITRLNPGEFASFTAEHVVTQADIDNGQISNTATARAIFDGLTITDLSDDTDQASPSGNDDPTLTFIRQVPDIVITKDDQRPYVPQNMSVGDVINYEILVTNTGNVTFNVANVTDNNANITNGNPIVNLTPGNTAVVLARHTVTQADLDAGVVINSATVEADFNGVTYSDISDDTDPGAPIGNDDPTKTFLVQNPEITIMKDDGLPYVDQNLFVGDVINYTIVVTNTGNVTITEDINLTDDNAVMNSNVINGLAVGESATINATHIVTQDDIDAGRIENSVEGLTSFGNIDVSDISDDSDVDSPSGSDDPTITFITQRIDFELVKDDQLNYDPQPLSVGDIINYNITFTNLGNVTLTNILIEDQNAIILSGNPIPTLAPGESALITAMHTVTQADIDAGEVINQARASTNFLGTVYDDLSDDTDILSPVGNDDPTITHIQKYSGLSVTKLGVIQTSNMTCPKPGEKIIYTFEVRNTGNQNISDVAIQDPQITEPITYVSGDIDGDGKLGQNEIWIFNGSITLDQSMVDLGYFDNQAVVHGIDPQNISISDISDDPTDPTDDDLNNDGDPDDKTRTVIPQHADLILLKEGFFNDENGDGLADVGETITYKFTVKNRCNVTIKDIRVDDPLIQVNPAAIILGAGQEDSTTFTGTYMITLADIDRGYVLNSATVSGIDVNNNTVTDISDDPNDFSDVDIENDGEPDDPTKVMTPNIHIYEILTPNNDGYNDFFRILGIESFPNAVVKIYNRWGTLVFESSGYNNTNNYWDGTNQFDKKKLPVGVYYYVIDLGLKKVEKIYTGSVYLNR